MTGHPTPQGILAKIADETFDVVISRPGYDTIRFHAAWKHRAESWAARLGQALTCSAHPEGTVVAIRPHADGDGCASPDPGPEGGLTGLAAAIPREHDRQPPESRFPDLFDRLWMVHGCDRAGELWSAACSLADQWAEEEEADPMTSDYVETLDTVTDVTGIDVPVGIDHDSVSIGAYRFGGEGLEELARLLVAASWGTQENRRRMDEEAADDAADLVAEADR